MSSIFSLTFLGIAPGGCRFASYISFFLFARVFLHMQCMCGATNLFIVHDRRRARLELKCERKRKTEEPGARASVFVLFWFLCKFK